MIQSLNGFLDSEVRASYMADAFFEELVTMDVPKAAGNVNIDS